MSLTMHTVSALPRTWRLNTNLMAALKLIKHRTTVFVVETEDHLWFSIHDTSALPKNDQVPLIEQRANAERLCKTPDLIECNIRTFDQVLNDSDHVLFVHVKYDGFGNASTMPHHRMPVIDLQNMLDDDGVYMKALREHVKKKTEDDNDRAWVQMDRLGTALCLTVTAFRIGKFVVTRLCRR